MKRYLVTGGNGLIGSHLCSLIESKGHYADKFIGDIRDLNWIAHSMKDIDGCFHLAAISSIGKCRDNVMLSNSVNHMGSINVFGAASKLNIPVVYASSSAVYAESKNEKLNENSHVYSNSFYGIGKITLEMLARTFSEENRGVRLFNVYGFRKNNLIKQNDAVSIFIRKILSGSTISINGNGKQERDFIYVKDVARILLMAMENKEKIPAIINGCTGKETSINELIEVVSSIAGIHAKTINIESNVSGVSNSIGDGSLAKELLLFLPEYELHDGIKEMINQ